VSSVSSISSSVSLTSKPEPLSTFSLPTPSQKSSVYALATDHFGSVIGECLSVSFCAFRVMDGIMSRVIIHMLLSCSGSPPFISVRYSFSLTHIASLGFSRTRDSYMGSSYRKAHGEARRAYGHNSRSRFECRRALREFNALSCSHRQ